MGCDIHSYAEKQEGGRWVVQDVQAFEDRNYRFFGWLANVRNYSEIKPLAADRGFPSDASAEVAGRFQDWGFDAHSASWVSLDELLAVDYDRHIKDREGNTQTLREFLRPGFFVDLKRLQDSKTGRVVFWFDN